MKVCSAYGAGFFFIPGTDTCLKIGGRVRADYIYVPAKDIYSGLGTDNTSGAGGNADPVVGTSALRQHTSGFEARGCLSFDARTQTAWGTVQSVIALRMTRQGGAAAAVTGDSKGSVSSALEAAYIRFAGFTFGAARDNFAFMPGRTYGAGHWAAFGNGAQQIAYTATLGGGISATVAIQNHNDTTLGGGSAFGGTYLVNKSPQINANLRVDQSWGALQLMGAAMNVEGRGTTGGSGASATTSGAYNNSENVYAIGAGVSVKLPMLSKSSALHMTAAYADGMTEYTTNWGSNKSSSFRRDVGGFTINHPSYVYESTGIETVKSWGIAALLEHFWAPQYRSVVFGSYGKVDAPTTAKANLWDGKTNFGDATVWNVGTNFAWLPTWGMAIGVEVIYSRVNQDVLGYTGGFAAGTTAATESVVRRSDSNVTGRLRVERNF